MSIQAIGAASMSAVTASMNQRAGRLATAGAPVGDTVDLSSEAVGMIQDSNQFQLTLAMVDIANQMDATMLSLLG